MDTIDEFIKIIQNHLSYTPEKTIFFRTSDGSKVTGEELISLLEKQDPIAQEYIRDVISTALHLVRIKEKRIEKVVPIQEIRTDLFDIKTCLLHCKKYRNNFCLAPSYGKCSMFESKD